MDIKTIITDIDELGFPTIHQYRHGYLLNIKPDGYEIGEEFGEIIFTLAKQRILSFSTLGEVSLVEVRRPANLLGRFKKCYAVKVEDDIVCYFCWD